MRNNFIYLLICSILLLVQNMAFGQNQLGLKAKQIIENKGSESIITLLAKGNPRAVKSIVEELEGNITVSIDQYSAIQIKKENLDLLLTKLDNIQLEMPVSNGRFLMDTAIVVNNIQAIHDGVSPLPQGYKGSGVIVGILDAGIYFDHDDFKNPDGTTRIRYIWDQGLTSNLNAPAPYNYGEEWNWIDINNGSCNHIEPSNEFGHGTTVAGAACGNGLATGYFTGVAPESEIIAVRVETNDNEFLSHVVDAIDYVFKKADAMGKPCVINTSIGTYYGSHDGLDIATQMIDALIDEKSGRAVVAAAGNGNNIGDSLSNFVPTHLSYEVSADTSFTWFEVLPDQTVYFDLWADETDFDSVSFAISNDDTSSYELLSTSNYFTIQDFPGDLTDGVYIINELYNDSAQLQGTLEMFATLNEGRYHIEFLITPTDLLNYWRFSTTGSGNFDIWSSRSYQGTSNMVYEDLPSSTVLPAIVNYKFADNEKCIVSSWQCSNKVITVANYSNRSTYYDVDSTFRSTNEEAGRIFFRSSEGPTRDGRLKPDISATGNITFATGNLNFIASALAVNRKRVAHDTLHNSNGGTSMASPIVAGAVALYLEANPTAWWYETKAAVIQTAKLDNYTGNSANTIYGNGKLNGLEMIKFEAVTGCTESNAFNYNPLANVDDGSCIPIVFGCIDSTAFNYNPLANTDDGSCIPIVLGCTDSTALNYNPSANVDNDSCIYPPISIIDIDGYFALNIFPNPVNNELTIDYQAKLANAPTSITITDTEGRQIKSYHLQNSSTFLIDFQSFQAGVYYIVVQSENRDVSYTKKIVKL